MRCLSLIAALCLFPAAALGATFSTPIPDLIGAADSTFFIEGKEASFDFGQQFSHIENVWIEVEARVFAQQFDVCGTIFDPQPCVHEIQLLGFFAHLDEEEFPRPGTVSSRGLSFSDDFRALEGHGTDSAVFLPFGDWDFLLDGEGSLILFWNNTSGDPDRIIQNFVAPSGEIINARLIVEGTPIPEPSTALLVAAGLLLVIATHRNRPTLR